MHKPGLGIDFVKVWEGVPAFLCSVSRHHLREVIVPSHAGLRTLKYRVDERRVFGGARLPRPRSNGTAEASFELVSSSSSVSSVWLS